MDINTLRSQTETFFVEKGYSVGESEPGQAFDLLFSKEETVWGIALLADHVFGDVYLRSFEEAMQALISDRQHDKRAPREKKLALALAFDSTLEGLALSYRRSLNKYSNSIIFVDLDIHLLTVQDGNSIQHYTPELVNEFLRNLNSLIATKKSRS